MGGERVSKAEMNAGEISDYLQSLADPKIAEHSQRFFKTGEGEYGHGDSFLGIRVPTVRQALKRYRSATPEVAQELLHSRYHEIRLFALLLLVYKFERGTPDEQEKIYTLYLNHTPFINNWDLVDSSAPYIVGKYLEDKERSVLYALARSASLWERRIAVLAAFHFIRQGDFKDILAIAEVLLNDREDLIHKAVGWMLREVGKRDAAALLSFLDAHGKAMPRTMLRYAIEKFDDETRRHYMQRQP